jgi:hypothetical protein
METLLLIIWLSLAEGSEFCLPRLSAFGEAGIGLVSAAGASICGRTCPLGTAITDQSVNASSCLPWCVIRVIIPHLFTYFHMLPRALPKIVAESEPVGQSHVLVSYPPDSSRVYVYPCHARHCSPAGRYQDTGVAPITCARCPAGSYSAVVGATSLATCQPCATGQRSPAGASACSVACPLGTNATTSTSNQCFQCQGGRFRCPASSLRGERRLGGTMRSTQLVADADVNCRAGFYKVATSSGKSFCTPW